MAFSPPPVRKEERKEGGELMAVWPISCVNGPENVKYMRYRKNE